MPQILAHLIQPAMMAAILAGAFAVALMQNGWRDFSRGFAAFIALFRADPQRDCETARAVMLKVDHLAQLRGLSCTDRACNSKRPVHPFVNDAVRKLANSERIDQFESWIDQELGDRARRHAGARNMWISIADAAPALGMAGTIIGLIGMFAAMDDPSRIGPAMALAMLTTLYGILLANIVAAPIAGRLEKLSAAELDWQRELAGRMLTVARRENAPVRRASIREVA